MMAFLNGKLVPEEKALVSIFDRSFLYGDGLFETILIANGFPFRWTQHLERLERGAAFLGISVPLAPDDLLKAARELIRHNGVSDALLRLTLSRGVGLRGYSPRGADSPTLSMTLHPTAKPDPAVSPQWHLRTASFRLPAHEPLAQFKTCNKLPQILARGYAEQTGADEALLLNTEGYAVEGASSNLFWVQREVLCTAPLSSGILAGVTRAMVMELAHGLKMPIQEREITPGNLARTDGVFLSLTSMGIVEAVSLDGQPLRQSPLTQLVRDRYWQMVARETATL